MTFPIVIVSVLLAVVFVRSRPEVVLTAAALVVPAGSFHPSLAAVTPIGNLNPFTVTVLVAGTFYAATKPGALSRGIQSAPGVVGVATMVVGSVAAMAAWQPAAVYWVVSGGLVLVLVSTTLVDRYQQRPGTVICALTVGGLISAASILWEQAQGRHIAWTAGDPVPVDFLTFRPSGLAGNSLLASATLAVVLAIVVTSEMAIKVRLLIGTTLVAAIMATLTRSTMIAAALAVLGFLVYRHRKHRWMATARLAILFLGVPAAIAYYWTQADLIAQRLGGSMWSNDSDLARTENLQIAWGQVTAHPIFGLGFGGFQRYGLGVYGSEHASLATADNMYLTAMAEVGMFGCLAFVLVAVNLNGIRVKRVRRGQVAGRLAPLIVVAVLSLFFDSLFHDGMLYLFAVSLLIAVPPEHLPDSELPHDAVDGNSRDGTAGH